MVGFTQFHHLVVVGGGGGMELLGTGRTPRRLSLFGTVCVSGEHNGLSGDFRCLFSVLQNRADGIHVSWLQTCACPDSCLIFVFCLFAEFLSRRAQLLAKHPVVMAVLFYI